MKPPTLRTAVFLIVDASLLAVCVMYLPSLLDSARLPFETLSVNKHIEVEGVVDTQAVRGIAAGDRIALWDGVAVETESDMEFFRFSRAPGDTVWLTLEAGRRVPAVCIRSYDLTYIVIILTVGFITWGLGVFVLLARPRELAAATLHWSLVFMGVSTMLTWGRMPPGDLFPYIARGVFLVVYIGVPSVFLFFMSIFPRPKPGPFWFKATASFFPAAILLVILVSTLFRAMAGQSLPMYRVFQRWFDLFHVLLILNVGAGLLSILDSYRRAETRVERKKIEWILWGLAFGPTPFLFLVVLPELFGRPHVIPEELSVVFFLLIPLSFAASFVKHHVLDIEVVIKRTTAYAIVLGIVIGLYALFLASLSAYVGAYVPGTAVLAAVGVAVLFEPVRKRVQHVVDRRFFRVQYDFRRTARIILEAIESAPDEATLGDIVVRRMDEVIPVNRIALIAALPGSQNVRVLAEKGWPGAGSIDGNPCLCAGEAATLPAARERAFEAGVPHTIISADVASRMNLAAVFPLADENHATLGCIALGPKRSDARFSAEDVDLLIQVAAECGLALQRIRLQYQLLLEQLASRRLEELNKLKSDFVSYVGHELRTPLTSIKMFAEILRSRRLRLGRSAREYVGVIEGESDRLGRMVATILDSARIEQGLKEYRLVPGDLREYVRRALLIMSYQLKQNGFAVSVKRPRKALPVAADPDAVIQAAVNLIANSIKYSADRKHLSIRLGRRESSVICTVRDRGRGIRPEVLPHLFERFYRAPEVRPDVQGVGLGLPLVRHIMEAHRGSVEVESVVGKGSAFTLVFPAFDKLKEPA